MINATHKFNGYCIQEADQSNPFAGLEVEITERFGGYGEAGYDVMVTASFDEAVAVLMANLSMTKEAATELIMDQEVDFGLVEIEANEAEQLIAI